MPIYCVIVQQDRSQPVYSVWRIIKVIECTLDEVSSPDWYVENIGRYINTQDMSQTMLFLREADNPFKNWQEEIWERRPL